MEVGGLINVLSNSCCVTVMMDTMHTRYKVCVCVCYEREREVGLGIVMMYE